MSTRYPSQQGGAEIAFCPIRQDGRNIAGNGFR